MGLGKTIQTIALLASLACDKGIWGPHLIVVPTSILINWEIEFKRWCPSFKIMSYFGSPKERKAKRQVFKRDIHFILKKKPYLSIVYKNQTLFFFNKGLEQDKFFSCLHYLLQNCYSRS